MLICARVPSEAFITMASEMLSHWVARGLNDGFCANPESAARLVSTVYLIVFFVKLKAAALLALTCFVAARVRQSHAGPRVYMLYDPLLSKPQ